MLNIQHEPVNLENYIRLLELIFEPEDNFALFDHNHSILWSTTDYSGPDAIKDKDAEDSQCQPSDMIKLDYSEDKRNYLKAFQIYQKGSVGFVIIQKAAPLSIDDLKLVSGRLDNLQGSVAESDYSQHSLVNKANELQELHYAHQPTPNNITPDDVDQEVKKVLKDCIRSLDCIGTFVSFNDTKMVYSEVPDETSLSDCSFSEYYRNTVIQRDLMRLCETARSAFILEQSVGQGMNSLYDGLDQFHVMVVPILDDDKQCQGVMTCLRKKSHNAFVKSELRLFEVLSERAYQNIRLNYDSVTGFLNHDAFKVVVEQELINQSDSSKESSFLMLKLYDLNQVYASGGLSAGAHILSQVAALLSQRIRSRDFTGRLDRDEFALILHNCSLENAQLMATQVLESVAQFTFEWQGKAIKLDASIGLVTIKDSLVSSDNLIRAARDAAKSAIDMGSYQHHVFTGKSNQHEEVNRLAWEHRIFRTVINKSFRLFCQPIEDAGTYGDGIQRYELLLRLKNNSGVLVAPNIFIKAARDLGLMSYVDRWVVTEAFKLSSSLNTHNVVALYNFTINLSADSLNSGFADFIVREAERQGVLADSICFDLTELAAMENLKNTNRVISLLRKRGFEVALDDFGTGVGAYSTLRNISVDYVKLDGNLVKNIASDSVSAAIVSSITKVCHALGIKTIAESVENEVIREQLKRTSVDFIQGYQTARPRPIETEFNSVEASVKNAS